MKFTTEKNIVLENPATKSFLVDAFVPEKKEITTRDFCSWLQRL